MEQQLPERPRPEPDHDNLPYWEGLKTHRLLVQRCQACGQLRHYPRPLCAACYSMDYQWHELSGQGRVHTWTVSHHPFHPAFKRDVPYTTVTVDMDEGVRVHAPLVDFDASNLKVGLAVVVDYCEVDADLTQPFFRVPE